MKSLRLSALVAVLALAACSSPAPTDPALLDSATPSFDEGPGMVGSGNKDGGGMLGSGNNSMDDGGVGTMGSGGGTGSGGDATTTNTGGTTTSDSTGTQRGGGSLGSGN